MTILRAFHLSALKGFLIMFFLVGAFFFSGYAIAAPQRIVEHTELVRRSSELDNTSSFHWLLLSGRNACSQGKEKDQANLGLAYTRLVRIKLHLHKVTVIRHPNSPLLCVKTIPADSKTNDPRSLR